MRIDDKRIAERCRRPRCKGFEGAYDGAATGENPFCGDALEVRVALERRACGLAGKKARNSFFESMKNGIINSRAMAYNSREYQV